MSETSKEVWLASRPRGVPTAANFDIVDVPVPEPTDGQVLVRNHFFSVDPYMRGRMNAGRSYAPAYEVGAVMSGAAVGEVIASKAGSLPVGTTVLHNKGWREYAAGAAAEFSPVDPDLAPRTSAYLGVLGSTGFTAYVGLLDFGEMREGDAVYVSAAAGAVGSVAGQITRLRGASRVIGSTGSNAKVSYLTDKLHFDAAFNYHSGPVVEQLARAAPNGIDVFFDNVGGEQLEAAIECMNNYGRIAACGAISTYNDIEPAPGPRNMFQFVARRLSMRGFLIFEHNDRRAAFLRDVGAWLRSGELRADETEIEGIEQSPAAFLAMMRGENTGKMVVRV